MPLGPRTLALAAGVFVLARGATSAAAPRAEFEEVTFDFGTAAQQAQVEHIYRFHNRGDAPLNVGPVETSCGCTAAVLSKMPIPPGGQGEVRVVYSSGFQRGEETKTITVHTDDPSRPVVQLTLKGKVVAEVDVRPMTLIFGNLQRGDPVEREVTLEPAEPKGFKVRKVRASRKEIEAQLASDGPERWTVRVALSPKIPVGDFKGVVEVETNARKSGTIKIPVLAVVQGELHVEPQSFYLSVVGGGAARTRSVVLVKSGKADLEIRKVVPPSPYLGVEVRPLEAGARYEIRLTVGPGAPAGPLHGAVQVQTNDEEQPILSIPVVGYVQGPPGKP